MTGLPEKLSKVSEHASMQTKTPTKLDIAHQRHAAYYNIVLDVANQFYLEGEDGIDKGLWLLDLEWPNIEAGQGWAAL
jgi:hypothetical protein